MNVPRVPQFSDSTLFDVAVQYRSLASPWHVSVGGQYACIRDDAGKLIAEVCSNPVNAAFIVQTVNLVPALIREIMRLRALVAQENDHVRA